ncbi:MAG: ChaN family lipoprotein [Casimicrobiaceae bacterium]
MSSLRAYTAALLAVASLLAACAPPAARLRSADDATIWDVRAGRFIDRAALVEAIVPVRFRLLGEVHDNPVHHRLRAELIDAIGQSGRRPAVVVEQFDFAGEPALAAVQQRGADAEGLASAGALDRRAWRWPLHAPVLTAALRAHMPVHAGNAPRAVLAAVMRTGDLQSLEPALRARVDRASWTADQAAALAAEIREGHCNKLPESAVPRLALAQRVRDAAMAEVLARDATADGAILIAGNGHVRRDLAVAAYLEVPATQVVAVAWLEAGGADRRSPVFPANVITDPSGFDYVWFTPPMARPDPCLGLP